LLSSCPTGWTNAEGGHEDDQKAKKQKIVSQCGLPKNPGMILNALGAKDGQHTVQAMQQRLKDVRDQHKEKVEESRQTAKRWRDSFTSKKSLDSVSEVEIEPAEEEPKRRKRPVKSLLASLLPRRIQRR